MKWSEVAQSCPTLCDPMDCNLSGSSIHGIFQPRVLEWIAISFSRGFSQPRNRIRVSCIAGRFFTDWAMREAYQHASKWLPVQIFWTKEPLTRLSSCLPELMAPSTHCLVHSAFSTVWPTAFVCSKFSPVQSSAYTTLGCMVPKREYKLSITVCRAHQANVPFLSHRQPPPSQPTL